MERNIFAAKNQYPYFYFILEEKKSVSFVFGHSLLSAQPPAKLKMR